MCRVLQIASDKLLERLISLFHIFRFLKIETIMTLCHDTENATQYSAAHVQMYLCFMHPICVIMR
jgi:hypothetical protein